MPTDCQIEDVKEIRRYLVLQAERKVGRVQFQKSIVVVGGQGQVAKSITSQTE